MVEDNPAPIPKPAPAPAASAVIAFEVLTPAKIVLRTLVPPSMVGKTLLLTIDCLTVVPALIS